MAKIRIARNAGWLGALAGIEIFVDGKKIGTVDNGETQDYEVENGQHEVYAKMGWDRSQKTELNIVEDETTVLKLTQYEYGTLILLISFGLQLLHILGKESLNFGLKDYLIVQALVILHPIYYFIKKRTVVLTEIDK
jgi:hypothetical protein